jgi:NADPH-dependent F420 reductase
VSLVRIGVIGGTGPAGLAVAVQLAGIGEEVVIGSRSYERAAESVASLQAKWPKRDLALVAGDNAQAADADIVVIATPWEGVLSTTTPLRAALEGKLVISMVNALTRWGAQMIPLTVPTGSITAALAIALPGARVTGAFHHLPAEQWGDLDHDLDADVLVCADRRADAREVVALVDRLPGLRGVDAGGLGSALAIEALTPVLIGINIRYKSHTALRLTGLSSPAAAASSAASSSSAHSSSAASSAVASSGAGSSVAGSSADGSSAHGEG